MAETYDAIIIGAGAGGGTLTRHLARSGKRILLIARTDDTAAPRADRVSTGELNRMVLAAARGGEQPGAQVDHHYIAKMGPV